MKETDKGIALFSPSPGRVDADKVDVVIASRVVAGLFSGWRNAPDRRVVATRSDLPAVVREELANQGEQTARGVFHGDTFYLVADEHASEAEVEETAFHEVWAHYGLRSMLGARTTRELAGVFDTISTSGYVGLSGRDAFRAFARRHGFETARTESMLRKGELLDPRFTEAVKKRIMVEELVARVQEKGVPAGLKRKVQEVIGAIREWLRAAGFGRLMKYSDADLMRLVQRARDTVVYGKAGSSGKGKIPAVFMVAWHGSPHDHDGFDSNKKPAEDEYLLWDKPLSEQSEKVKAALRSLGNSHLTEAIDAVPVRLESGDGEHYFEYLGNTYATKREALEDITGMDVVRSRRFDIAESPREVSAALLASGIRGIKYLDGGSRGAGAGSFNYVIFDDADIEITAKFSRADRSAIETATRRMDKFVAEFEAGRLRDSDTQALGDTPVVLRHLGTASRSLQIDGATVRKALAGKHRNDLSADALRRVAESLYDPLAVFDSATGDGMVILTEIASNNDKPVVAIVHLNKAHGSLVINDVASVHEKTNAEASLMRWINSGLLRYVRNEKDLSGAATRHPLPASVAALMKGRMGSVVTEADVVNQYGSRYSHGRQSANAHTAPSLRSAIEAIPGKAGDAIRALVGDGKNGPVRIITASQIPQRITEGKSAEGIRAYVDPQDGNVHLVADNIPNNWTASQLEGLFKHEVAVHVMRMGKTDAEFQKLLANAEALRRHGNKAMQAAFDRVPEDTSRAHVREEGLAYFVEANQAHGLNDSPMAKRAALIDKGNGDGYWSRIIERAARSFENYVIHKMAMKGYAIAKTLHGMIHDVETGRYLDWLATTYAKKPGEEIAGKVVGASKRMRDTFKPGEWVQVPETKIPGTQVLEYGKLAGRYLPGPIWNDVRQTVGLRFNGSHHLPPFWISPGQRLRPCRLPGSSALRQLRHWFAKHRRRTDREGGNKPPALVRRSCFPYRRRRSNRDFSSWRIILGFFGCLAVVFRRSDRVQITMSAALPGVLRYGPFLNPQRGAEHAQAAAYLLACQI